MSDPSAHQVSRSFASLIDEISHLIGDILFLLEYVIGRLYYLILFPTVFESEIQIDVHYRVGCLQPIDHCIGAGNTKKWKKEYYAKLKIKGFKLISTTPYCVPHSNRRIQIATGCLQS